MPPTQTCCPDAGAAGAAGAAGVGALIADVASVRDDAAHGTAAINGGGGRACTRRWEEEEEEEERRGRGGMRVDQRLYHLSDYTPNFPECATPRGHLWAALVGPVHRADAAGQCRRGNATFPPRPP